MARALRALACLLAVWAAPASAADTVIHVASNGWHSGIIVPREAVVASGAVPEAADFPGAVYLEFGWGDREYFPEPETTFGMGLRAAMTPTPATLHVVGLDLPPPQAYPEAEVMAVTLPPDGVAGLLTAIGGFFERPDGERARQSAPGLFPSSRFYDARGRFSLAETCNRWTARMLQAAGLDLSPDGVVTAGQLMDRLRAALETAGDAR